MIHVQPFEQLGRFSNAWLNARYHFNFGQYRAPARSGIGGLVVWNDDEIAPGSGFDPHPHSEMEIITYVREGAITHRDSLGNEGRTRGRLRAGDACRHRHRACRVQPGANPDPAVPDLDPAGHIAGETGLGHATIPQIE